MQTGASHTLKLARNHRTARHVGKQVVEGLVKRHVFQKSIVIECGPAQYRVNLDKAGAELMYTLSCNPPLAISPLAAA